MRLSLVLEVFNRTAGNGRTRAAAGDLKRAAADTISVTAKRSYKLEGRIFQRD